MNENIIRFYLFANKLKEKVRTGWIEVEISGKRLESVAEHIFGCLILAIGIDSEYKLNLDMYKVLKMLTLHELEEIIMKDFTIRDNVTKEEKIELGRKYVKIVTDGLIKQDEIITLNNVVEGTILSTIVPNDPTKTDYIFDNWFIVDKWITVFFFIHYYF